MDIKWIGANANNFGVGRNGLKVNKIVMHWIVGTLASSDATFNSPTRLASAHYGVGPNEVHQYVKEVDTAWHASNLTVNRESIGIEHEGGKLLSDGTREVPSEATLKRSAELIADICKRYNLPIDRNTIHVHNEYKATTCPGTLDVGKIIELAKAINAPIPIPQPVITDQTKIPQIDNMEVQAIRSKLNDQNNQINSLNSKIAQIRGIVQ
jgi:N-acetyl-anhydromuramyl-L-alanine amidase AmpD